MKGGPPARADDRRKVANKETTRLSPTHVVGGLGTAPQGRRAAFDGGFFAQSEARLAASADSNVGQGKARAQEREWGR